MFNYIVLWSLLLELVLILLLSISKHNFVIFPLRGIKNFNLFEFREISTYVKFDLRNVPRNATLTSVGE